MANLVMQDQMALMPLQSGAAILPLALAFTVASQLTAPWTTWHGMRVLFWGCAEQLTELAAFGLALCSTDRCSPSVALVVFGSVAAAPPFAATVGEVPSARGA